MKRLLLALLLFTGAAQAAQPELVFHDAPRPMPHGSFTDGAGKPIDIGAFAGKVVVMDFWATWCLPCRKEFPALERLQAQLGPQGLVVVPVSVDRKGMPAVDKFYDELGLHGLGKYLDDSRDFAQALGVRGLPTTLVIDAQGQEIARIEGPAAWDGQEIGDKLRAVLKR